MTEEAENNRYAPGTKIAGSALTPGGLRETVDTPASPLQIADTALDIELSQLSDTLNILVHKLLPVARYNVLEGASKQILGTEKNETPVSPHVSSLQSKAECTMRMRILVQELTDIIDL